MGRIADRAIGSPTRRAATWRRLREGRPRVDVPGTGTDPDIVAMVAEPYSSPAETRQRLWDLHSVFEARDDSRAVFLSIYARMTSAVADRITRGEFADPDWVADYLVAFANLYRVAVHDYELDRLDRVVDPWQLAFRTAECADSLVIQDAALGVNAHINYDLAYALVEAGTVPNRSQKYADHRAVTEVIRGLVAEAQTTLAREYAAGIRTIDETLGSLDDWLTVFTIDECRESAWRNAIAMTSRFGPRRWFARWVTNATATGAAYLILASRPSETLHGVLKELEGGPMREPNIEDASR